MSDTLTDAAPVEPTAVAPVGEPAPVTNSEVDEGSGDRNVPVERFNGLMSSFNRLQSEKADLEKQLSELRSNLETKPTQETPAPVSDDTSAQIRELRDMLVEERLKSARRDVLDEFPEAKPFADLIVADSPDDLRSMARLIAERVKGIAPGPAPVATDVVENTEVTTPVVETQPVVEVPVAGGNTLVEGNPNSEDRVVEAIKNRSFSDYLTAKWEQSGDDSVLEATG